VVLGDGGTFSGMRLESRVRGVSAWVGSQTWRAAFRVLFAVPLLVSCAIASKPESVGPAEFRLKAPQAKRVSVVGTFNGWDPDAHALQGPDRNGVWTLRLPLPPGQYRYMFVLDGVRWMADPTAVASQNDGFGGRNSLLFHGR